MIVEILSFGTRVGVARRLVAGIGMTAMVKVSGA